MCGICGVISLTGEAVRAEVVTRMADSIRHRGPDDSGVYIDGPIGLGHRRLSIIDLTAAGRQPMADESGDLIIVFNGEIYNFPEVRQALSSEGVRFRSHSDTEVILELYRKYSTDCPKHLRGMFAFAIWDRRERRMFLARDRVGIKPLYYYVDDSVFAFGSEIKAIYQIPGLDRSLSLDAVSTFFAYGHSFAPQTIYRRVQKLPAGHSVVIADGTHRITKYWDLPTEPDESGSLEVETRHLSALMADAVESHLLADVPVGVFLSGGIDSSVIAALAARKISRLNTFSVGFDIGGHYNETDAARLVASSIRSEHHELLVKAVDVPQLLNRLVWHFDEPFADAAAMPTYLLAEFARKSVKVALSGEGGDELFGGYRRYITQLLSRHYQILGTFLGPETLVRRSVGKLDGWRRVKKVLESLDQRDEARRYSGWLTSFTGGMRQQLFDGVLREHDQRFDVEGPYVEQMGRARGEPLTNLLMLDTKLWLPDTYLEKVDKSTMAVGLEARVPFLDHPVVEKAFSLPDRYKISRFRKKFILRKVAAGLVPAEILSRPKHGFAVPIDEWFRGELLGYVKGVLLDGVVARRGYFDIAAVERLIESHVKGQNDYGTQIWQLLNFELWHQQFIDQPVSPVPPGAIR